MTTAAIKATSVKILANDQHQRQVGEGEKKREWREGGFKAREESSVRLKVRFSMAINVDPPASEAMDPAKGDGPLFPEIRTVPLLQSFKILGYSSRFIFRRSAWKRGSVRSGSRNG